MTNIEIDGVEYENCLICKKEIIATKSQKCLDCFQKNKQLTQLAEPGDPVLGAYQQLGTARIARWR